MSIGAEMSWLPGQNPRKLPLAYRVMTGNEVVQSSLHYQVILRILSTEQFSTRRLSWSSLSWHRVGTLLLIPPCRGRS